ncbi:uncharacterized protein LOC129918152 [Episyrphus balteatus]|uniref:uncharacterized protein LOC129918152 n=1 Tax=Episyrphus balteatus TaxID=286459 RepID=UPI0024863B2A|nr:uncharacterized protein LOC129918152 [Episyrphus balteatus]
MINVLAVFQNFSATLAYYSYRNFGSFMIEEFIWNKKDAVVFPNRMANLHGAVLPVYFKDRRTAVILSKTNNGRTVIGGYLGNIFNTFAKRHNARLNISDDTNSLSNKDILELVSNGTIDIADLGPMLLRNPIQWFSYPYLTIDWGIILPIETNIPINKVFGHVFDWQACVLTILVLISLAVSLGIVAMFSGSSCNFFTFIIDCFRGMLGQSFSESPKAFYSTKIIYSSIFFFGIMIVTSYNAFLQSLMTKLPKENVIRTFEDVQTFGLKIYLTQAEFDLHLIRLRPDLMEKYSKIFQAVQEDKKEKLFDINNPKYAFTVTSNTWMNVENQQNFFGRKFYRWSKELILFKNQLAAIHLNENSIYKKALNFHILETQSSGLMDYWTKRSFYEILGIQEEVIKFDFEPEVNLRQMKVEDLKWICN